MPSYIRARVSRPFKNPFIMAKGLNPVRAYDAYVIVDGKVREHLTGVIFHNQGVTEQIQHHALVRRHGKLPVKFVRGSGR